NWRDEPRRTGFNRGDWRRLRNWRNQHDVRNRSCSVNFGCCWSDDRARRIVSPLRDSHRLRDALRGVALGRGTRSRTATDYASKCLWDRLLDRWVGNKNIVRVEVSNVLVRRLNECEAMGVERHRQDINEAGKDQMASIGTRDCLPVQLLIDEDIFPEDPRTESTRHRFVTAPQGREIFPKRRQPARQFPIQARLAGVRSVWSRRLLLCTARGGHGKTVAYRVAGLYLGKHSKLLANNVQNHLNPIHPPEIRPPVFLVGCYCRCLS